MIDLDSISKTLFQHENAKTAIVIVVDKEGVVCISMDGSPAYALAALQVVNQLIVQDHYKVKAVEGSKNEERS